MGTRTRFGLAIALLLALATKGHAQETGGSFDSEDWGSEPSEPSSWGSSSDWGSEPSEPSEPSSWGSWGSDDDDDDWASSTPSPPPYEPDEHSDPTPIGSGRAPYPSSGYDTSPYPRTDYDTSPQISYAAPTAPATMSWVVIVVGVITFVCFVLLLVRLLYVPPPPREVFDGDHLRVVGPRPVAGLVDVSMLQLAIDWRARRFVQAELAELARGGDTQSKEGRLALLRATTKALRSVRLAWLYAGARNFRPMQQSQAQREFQQIANDVRASFRQEIVRASAGRVVSVEAVGVRARESEGPGVVLVSVIVAARREIFDVDAQRASSIDRLIASLEALSATDVIALSVVWTPAAEEDRMSTDELEARHRHLVRIGDIGGRVFCGYCSGPHAQELASCPHCGAPTGAPPASAG